MTEQTRLGPIGDWLDDMRRHHHGDRIVDLASGILDHRTLQRPRGSGLVPYPRMVVAGVPIALVFLFIAAIKYTSIPAALEFHHSAPAELVASARVRSDRRLDEDVAASSSRPPTVYLHAPYEP